MSRFQLNRRRFIQQGAAVGAVAASLDSTEASATPTGAVSVFCCCRTTVTSGHGNVRSGGTTTTTREPES